MPGAALCERAGLWAPMARIRVYGGGPGWNSPHGLVCDMHFDAITGPLPGPTTWKSTGGIVARGTRRLWVGMRYVSRLHQKIPTCAWRRASSTYLFLPNG